MQISVSNKGEIELEAIRLMGASTKRGTAGQIGYFGTGLKYSMAWLLRNNFWIKIYSGTREIPIEVRPVRLRGQDFSEIFIDGQPSSITTDIGPNWEPWHILREIYCNAVDEGEADIKLGEYAPRAGRTTFQFGIDGVTKASLELMQVIASSNNYFIFGETPLHQWETVKVYDKDNPRSKCKIFRNGVLVYIYNKPSLYNYDIADLRLTEDRSAASEWDIDNNIGGAIANISDKHFAETILSATTDDVEFVAQSFAVYSDQNPKMLEAARKYILAPAGTEQMISPDESTKFVHSAFYNKLMEYEGMRSAVKYSAGDVTWDDREFTEEEKAKLTKAIAALHSHSFPITHEVRGAKFHKSGLLGMAGGIAKATPGQKVMAIFLSSDAFINTRLLIGTLVEEELHLAKNVRDNSRPMQDALLDVITRMVYPGISDFEMALGPTHRGQIITNLDGIVGQTLT